MPTPKPNRRKRGPDAEYRHALELLASCADGCTEAAIPDQ
jgi:hypothetical protein